MIFKLRYPGNRKKALFFVPFIVIMTLAALVTALILLNQKGTPLRAPIGEKQMEIIAAYQTGEEVLSYYDLAADYAAQQALYDLGVGGGYDLLGGSYEDESRCGTYLGFASWGDTETTCFPQERQREDAFVLYFERNLNEYLQAYPRFRLPLIDLTTLTVDGGELTVVGTTTATAEIPIGTYQAPAEYGMFAWPLDTDKPENLLITSCIGLRDCTNCLQKDHDGLDIDSVNYDGGTVPVEPVFAIASGTVVMGQYDTSPFNTIIIDHGNGYTSRYLHLNTRDVVRGQHVTQGERIGTVGGAGPIAYGWHLHLEIRKDNKRLDPLTFYDLEGLGIRFWTDSNCNYFAYNYPYASYVRSHLT